MFIFFTIITILCLILSIAYWLLKPYKYKNIKLDTSQWFFKEFIENAFDGSIMILELNRGKVFHQFVKVETKSMTSATWLLPFVEWSSRYKEPLMLELQRNKIEFNILENENETAEMLEVPSLDNVEQISDFLKIVFKVMEIPGDAMFSITYKGKMRFSVKLVPSEE